jgi:predicted acetyltransferase
MITMSSPSLTIGPPRNDAEIEAYARIMSQSLLIPPPEEYDWLSLLGRESFRLARVNGEIAGGLGIIEMGQWFGGRSVPMNGITLVGVAPHHRATGVAAALLKAALDEAHEKDVPLSGLYPATQPVYRRQGYERAGSRTLYSLPLNMIDIRDRSLCVRPIKEAEHETLHGLYRWEAQRTAGRLDRSAWLWKRVFEPRGQKTYGYIVERDGVAEGYVVFLQEKEGYYTYDLVVTDLVVKTVDAARRMLTLFADHRSAARNLKVRGGAAPPLLYLPAEQAFKIAERLDWMLRIVDVKRALEHRGYPPGVSTGVHLEVQDDVLPQNSRRFVLEVTGGRAKVHEGGSGRVRLDIRALAPIYSGFSAPAELHSVGYVEGPEDDLAALSSAFAGPTPWMPEIF